MYALCMSTKAYNITLPQKLVTRLDKTAKDNYMTRSDFIRYAVVKEIKIQEEDGWKTVVDFTKIRKDGVSAKEVLKALKSMR
jgi:Arc/MetJ-type ribon-helix-helix transcriptional regulator